MPPRPLLPQSPFSQLREGGGKRLSPNIPFFSAIGTRHLQRVVKSPSLLFLCSSSPTAVSGTSIWAPTPPHNDERTLESKPESMGCARWRKRGQPRQPTTERDGGRQKKSSSLSFLDRRQIKGRKKGDEEEEQEKATNTTEKEKRGHRSAVLLGRKK